MVSEGGVINVSYMDLCRTFDADNILVSTREAWISEMDHLVDKKLPEWLHSELWLMSQCPSGDQ